MGQGQCRLSDTSKVPSCVHGCPACPHPNPIGPAIVGSPDVLTNTRPSVRVGDMGMHAACCNTNIWKATKGSGTVFINNKAAHRINDADEHCGGNGQMTTGSDNVIVGG